MMLAQAELDLRGAVLRHIDVDVQLVDLRQREHRRAAAAGVAILLRT